MLDINIIRNETERVKLRWLILAVDIDELLGVDERHGNLQVRLMTCANEDSVWFDSRSRGTG